MACIFTNLKDIPQALRDNFKGVTNKQYIKDSLMWHYQDKWITREELLQLENEFGIDRSAN